MGTGKVVHLRVSSPIVDPVERVKNIQTLLRQRLDRFDSNKKEIRAIRALVAAIDGENEAVRENKVKDRLAKIQSSVPRLTPANQLDLLLIICLGHGRLSKDLRLDACALLQLGGSDENIEIVCTAFPGFKQVFD